MKIRCGILIYLWHFNLFIDRVNALNKKPLVNLIEKIGGWPMVSGDSWNETNWSWSGAFDALRSFTYKANDVYDGANVAENIIAVDDKDKGFTEDEEYKNYENALTVLITEIAKAIETNLTQEHKLDSQIKELIAFENELVIFARKLKKIKKENKKFKAGKALGTYHKELTWLNVLQPFVLAKEEAYVGEVEDDIAEKFLQFYNSTPKR